MMLKSPNKTNERISLERLKKRLNTSWNESYSSELPILPNKNRIREIRGSKSIISSRHLRDSESNDDSEIEEYSLESQMLMNQDKMSPTSSKISSQSFKVDFKLPSIKSKYSASQNLTMDTLKPYRELTNLTNQFQPRCFPTKNKLPVSPTEGQIKSLYMIQKSFCEESSSSTNSSLNYMKSNLTSPLLKPDFSKNPFVFRHHHGFYTDRPYLSRKNQILSTSSRPKKNGHFDGAEYEVPLLDIKSLSNSIDSSDTYKIYSTTNRNDSDNYNRSYSKSTSEESEKGVDFKTSDTSQEYHQTAKSNVSNKSQNSSTETSLVISRKPKRFTQSKIPIRVPTYYKKPTSIPPESKSISSDVSDNSHVSEYESNTMIVVTTSSPALTNANIQINDCANKSIVYRVSISNKNEEVQNNKELKMLMPAFLMNIQKQNSLPEIKKLDEDSQKSKKQDKSIPKITTATNEKISDKNVPEENIISEFHEDIKNKTTIKLVDEKMGKNKDQNVNRFNQTEYSCKKKKRKLSTTRSETAFDLSKKGQGDSMNALKCSASTSKLAHLAKPKKGQDRFLFTISQSDKKLHSRATEFTNQSNVTKEMRKHPSLVRLASAGLEPNYLDVINFLTIGSQNEDKKSKKKGFFHKLKMKFSKGKKEENESFKDNIGDTKLMNKHKISTVKSCEKLSRNETNDRTEIQKIFKRNELDLPDNEWIRQFDSDSEVSVFQENMKKESRKNLVNNDKISLSSKKLFRCSETMDCNNSNKMYLPCELNMKKSLSHDECLCFKWCHI